MIDFLTSYWLIVAPSALLGLYMLGLLKRARDHRSARPTPAPLPIKR